MGNGKVGADPTVDTSASAGNGTKRKHEEQKETKGVQIKQKGADASERGTKKQKTPSG